MSKVLQLNEALLHELALLINSELDFPEALVTVSYVDCSPDLKQAKVGFSVLPDRLSGTALRKLQAASGHLVGALAKRLPLRRLPHLIWEFDPTEKEAGKIERLIAGLGDEN